MPRLRLHHGLLYFRAAVGAFIGEVDLRQAPVRLDIAHEHGKSDATRTDHESRLDIVVMMNVGWHVGTPFGKHSPVTLDPNHSIRPGRKSDHELWRNGRT